MTLNEIKERLGTYSGLQVSSAYDGRILYRSWRNKKEILEKYGGLNIVRIEPKLRISSFSESAYPYTEIMVSDYNLRFKDKGRHEMQ